MELVGNAPVADPKGGGRPQHATRLWTKVLLISSSFLRKYGKFVCWRPPWSWRPLLQGILDLPMHYIAKHTSPQEKLNLQWRVCMHSNSTLFWNLSRFL